MTDTAIAEMTDDINVHLVARNPGDMQQSQQQLILWSDRKLAVERAELKDCEENLAIAKERKWRSAPWSRRAKLAKAKVVFYEKIKKALEAGYYIIPSFPVDIFAVRTDRERPNKQTSTNRYENFRQSARLLPAGEGRYVSDMPMVWQQSVTWRDREGQEKERTEYYPGMFEQVDFPLKLVKPAVLGETAKAMAMNVFDQMGSLPAGRKRGDPIVVGQIIPPHNRWEPLTFFVAWWLNTEDL